MRVISGEAKGRRFAAPKLDIVRPTSDRVREAIFDVVSHLGGVTGCRVLDLFAGSGAFGIEALSRGAAAVTFVEQNRIVTDQIRENLAAVGLSGRDVRFVTGDAIAYLRAQAERAKADRQKPVRVGTTGRQLDPSRAESAQLDELDVSPQRVERVDVTFCDPPYAYTNWGRLLSLIPGELIVLEHRRTLDLPEGLETYRVYRYGSTLVTVARRRDTNSAIPAMAGDRGRL